MAGDVHELPMPVPIEHLEYERDPVGSPLHQVGRMLVPMPWDIADRIREVDAAVMAVDRTVQASRGRLGADFVQSWTAFRENWRRFHDGHRHWVLYVARGLIGWHDIYGRVQEYEGRVQQWRLAAEERGVRFATPDATPAPVRRDDGEEDLFDKLQPFAVAGAVGLGALAVIAVIKSVSD
ncbi:MAG: hypothetical protein RLP09_48015 [Sandaracinaceae bacterium]